MNQNGLNLKLANNTQYKNTQIKNTQDRTDLKIFVNKFSICDKTEMVSLAGNSHLPLDLP